MTVTPKPTASACQISGLEREAVRECYLNLLSTPIPSHKTYFSPSYKDYGDVRCADCSDSWPIPHISSTVEMDLSQVFFFSSFC